MDIADETNLVDESITDENGFYELKGRLDRYKRCRKDDWSYNYGFSIRVENPDEYNCKWEESFCYYFEAGAGPEYRDPTYTDFSITDVDYGRKFEKNLCIKGYSWLAIRIKDQSLSGKKVNLGCDLGECFDDTVLYRMVEPYNYAKVSWSEACLSFEGECFIDSILSNFNDTIEFTIEI